MSSFEFGWDNNVFADAELHLYVGECGPEPTSDSVSQASASKRLKAADGNPRASGWVNGGRNVPRRVLARKLAVSKLLLAQKSPYFRRLIEGWSDPDKPLEVTVPADDLDSIVELIHFLYNGQVSKDNADEEVWKLLRLADQYGVEECVEQCALLLIKPPEQMSFAAAVDYLQLPEALSVACGGVKALVNAAQRRLLAQFGDLDAVMKSPERRGALLMLPDFALLALLKSDALRVQVEETVLVALSEWLHANAGVPTTAAEKAMLRELGLAPRYPAIAGTFLQQLLWREPWLKHLNAEVKLCEQLMVFFNAPASLREVVEERDCKTISFRPRRPVPPTERQPLHIAWQVPVQDLLRCIGELSPGSGDPAGSRRVASPDYFHNGYTWNLYLTLRGRDNPKNPNKGVDGYTGVWINRRIKTAAVECSSFVGPSFHISFTLRTVGRHADLVRTFQRTFKSTRSDLGYSSAFSSKWSTFGEFVKPENPYVVEEKLMWDVLVQTQPAVGGAEASLFPCMPALLHMAAANRMDAGHPIVQARMAAAAQQAQAP